MTAIHKNQVLKYARDSSQQEQPVLSILPSAHPVHLEPRAVQTGAQLPLGIIATVSSIVAVVAAISFVSYFVYRRRNAHSIRKSAVPVAFRSSAGSQHICITPQWTKKHVDAHNIAPPASARLDYKPTREKKLSRSIPEVQEITHDYEKRPSVSRVSSVVSIESASCDSNHSRKFSHDPKRWSNHSEFSQSSWREFSMTDSADDRRPSTISTDSNAPTETDSHKRMNSIREDPDLSYPTRIYQSSGRGSFSIM